MYICVGLLRARRTDSKRDVPKGNDSKESSLDNASLLMTWPWKFLNIKLCSFLFKIYRANKIQEDKSTVE